MITTAQLLEAAGKLPDNDLKQFVQRLTHLDASRREPPLPQRETELLRAISAEPPTERIDRYRYLLGVRASGHLSEEQLKELLGLSDWLEEVHAERLAHVAELAELREVSLPEMMKRLGLKHLVD